MMYEDIRTMGDARSPSRNRERSGGVARISRFTSNTNYYQGNTNYYYVLETLLFFASTSVATKNQLPTVPLL